MMPGVYGLLDPRTGELRYIGATSNLDRRRSESRSTHGARRTPRDLWVKELLGLGLRPLFEVLETCDSADEAFQREEWLVAYHRFIGCDLLNRALGGPTSRGTRHSATQRIANSVAQGGRPFVDQHGRRYETIKGAARELGLAANKICAVLKGKRSHTGGYRFAFIGCPQ